MFFAQSLSAQLESKKQFSGKNSIVQYFQSCFVGKKLSIRLNSKTIQLKGVFCHLDVSLIMLFMFFYLI